MKRTSPNIVHHILHIIVFQGDINHIVQYSWHLWYLMYRSDGNSIWTKSAWMLHQTYNFIDNIMLMTRLTKGIPQRYMFFNLSVLWCDYVWQLHVKTFLLWKIWIDIDDVSWHVWQWDNLNIWISFNVAFHLCYIYNYIHYHFITVSMTYLLHIINNAPIKNH